LEGQSDDMTNFSALCTQAWGRDMKRRLTHVFEANNGRSTKTTKA